MLPVQGIRSMWLITISFSFVLFIKAVMEYLHKAKRVWILTQSHKGLGLAI